MYIYILTYNFERSSLLMAITAKNLGGLDIFSLGINANPAHTRPHRNGYAGSNPYSLLHKPVSSFSFCPLRSADSLDLLVSQKKGCTGPKPAWVLLCEMTSQSNSQ